MSAKNKTDSTVYLDPVFDLLNVINDTTRKHRLKIRTEDLFTFFNFGTNEARKEMMNNILCLDDVLFDTVLRVLINEAAISPEFTNNIVLNKVLNKAVTDYAKEAVEDGSDTWGDC